MQAGKERVRKLQKLNSHYSRTCCRMWLTHETRRMETSSGATTNMHPKGWLASRIAYEKTKHGWWRCVQGWRTAQSNATSVRDRALFFSRKKDRTLMWVVGLVLKPQQSSPRTKQGLDRKRVLHGWACSWLRLFCIYIQGEKTMLAASDVEQFYSGHRRRLLSTRNSISMKAHSQ